MTQIGFSSRLKNLREEKGLTQAQFAEQFGVSISTLYAYETGRVLPSLDFLLKICHEYNLSLDFLVDAGTAFYIEHQKDVFPLVDYLTGGQPVLVQPVQFWKDEKHKTEYRCTAVLFPDRFLYEYYDILRRLKEIEKQTTDFMVGKQWRDGVLQSGTYGPAFTLREIKEFAKKVNKAKEENWSIRIPWNEEPLNDW